MMHQFSKGDQVILLLDGRDVGSGVVMKVLENDSLHSIRLGEGRIGVLVESSLYRSTRLPVPTSTNQFLSESVDSCVIWDCSAVRLIAELTPKGMSIGSCSNPISIFDEEMRVTDNGGVHHHKIKLS